MLRIVVVAFLLVPLVASGGEREVWALWQKHLRGLSDHAGMVEACRAYAVGLPEDFFLPVVRSLEAWHLLGAGRTDEGTQVLTPHLATGKSALDRGADRLARSWITRIQRNYVVDALQEYYRKEVRYPQDLDVLIQHPDLSHGQPVPLKDAWDKPWRYRLTGFHDVPGFRDQKYKLESTSIQPPFDVASALAMPYAGQIITQPIRVAQTVQGAPLVKLEHLGSDGQRETAVGQVGESVKGLYIAYAGQNLVILCDTLHWKVLTWKP